MIKAYRAAVLTTALLAACGGGGGNGEAQPGSALTMTPTSVTWNAKANVTSQFITQPYTIVVLRGAAPLKDTKVQVFLDLASGSTSGAPTMFLVDSSGTLQSSPFETTTNSVGAAHVSVIFPIGGGAAYKGSLQAFSGAASGNSVITVTCEDVNTATPACDF